MSSNVRGLYTNSKLYHVFKLSTYLQGYKLILMSLVENKLDTSSISRLQSFLPKQWETFHNNDLGCKGRILVLVDSQIWTYEFLHKSEQYITVQMENIRVFECVLTFVYASNFYKERDILWEHLVMDDMSIELPWLLVGDFNNASNPKDKRGVCLSLYPISLILKTVY